MIKKVEASFRQYLFPAIFVFLLLLCPLVFSEELKDSPVTSADRTDNYEKLLTELRALRKSGEFETQQQRVQRNWKTGVLVNAFVGEHVAYARVHELLVSLEKDLGKGQRCFADARDFARDYPAGPPDIDLPWTYFTITAAMTDAKQREALLRQALAEHWDTRRLAREAWKARFGEAKEKQPELEAALGHPGIYRIVTNNEHLSYELGFDTYRILSPEEAKKFKEGDFVSCGIADSRSRIQDAGHADFFLDRESCILNPEASVSDLFTRRAKILKIVDGDTVTAGIDLGFGIETLKKMRLRGIDAPELDTEAGPAAKDYLEKLLPQGEIVVRAEKSDKYNRALADVWGDQVYVNRKMIDDGQAVRMDE